MQRRSRLEEEECMCTQPASISKASKCWSKLYGHWQSHFPHTLASGVTTMWISNEPSTSRRLLYIFYFSSPSASMTQFMKNRSCGGFCVYQSFNRSFKFISDLFILRLDRRPHLRWGTKGWCRVGLANRSGTHLWQFSTCSRPLWWRACWQSCGQSSRPSRWRSSSGTHCRVTAKCVERPPRTSGTSGGRSPACGRCGTPYLAFDRFWMRWWTWCAFKPPSTQLKSILRKSLGMPLDGRRGKQFLSEKCGGVSKTLRQSNRRPGFSSFFLSYNRLKVAKVCKDIKTLEMVNITYLNTSCGVRCSTGPCLLLMCTRWDLDSSVCYRISSPGNQQLLSWLQSSNRLPEFAMTSRDGRWLT